MKHLTCIVLALAATFSLPAVAADKPAAKSAEAPANKRFRNVDVQEWEKLRKDSKVVVLDVRTAEEFADGHMPGAINLDIRGGKFAETLAGLDKSKTYLVHCAVGGRFPGGDATGQVHHLLELQAIHLAAGLGT
ncbi:MAG: rhodanese-like domain-containing protein, partial [Verrucomicrobiota bacterium]